MVAAGAVSFGLGREIVRRVGVQQEIERLTKSISEAQASTTQLEQLIATLKSPSYEEGAARTQLNLQKPGESVLVVPLADSPAANSSSSGSGPTPSQEESPQSNPERWWNFLFGTQSS